MKRPARLSPLAPFGDRHGPVNGVFCSAVKARIIRWAFFVLLAAAATRGAAQEPGESEWSSPQTRVGTLEEQNAEFQSKVMPRLPHIVEQEQAWNASRTSWNEADLREAFDLYMAERESQGGTGAAAEGHKADSDLDMSAKWNHGLELSTKDKDFRVHVGGRTQFDASWFDVDDNVLTSINTPYQDGVDFRRARLRIDGTMYHVVEWAVEYDFVNSQRALTSTAGATGDFMVTAFTDAWWTIKELPLIGNLRFGNQKEAIGFEHLVSSRFQPFMERSFNQDAFYGGAFNGFTPGIQAFNWTENEMGTWAIGLFKPTSNVFAVNATDGDYAVTGRLTRLLWWCDDGSGLLHVGISGRQFTTVADRIRYRTRDAIRAGLSAQWPIPADTGNLIGDDGQYVNGELVAMNGPWTFQSEYLVSFLEEAQLATTPAGPNVGTITYHGGYVQLLYFLTGEHDQYDRKSGTFGRVLPREPFFLVRTDDGPRFGRGAWQVGARYNYLDLNNSGINGGVLHNFSAGLNWFLNPNMKIQFDYSATHRDAVPVIPVGAAAGSGEGWAHGWGIRVAHDF